MLVITEANTFRNAPSFYINIQITQQTLSKYYLFLAFTLTYDTFIWQRLVYWYLFCVLYIIVILQNIENAFNFFISIFLGRGRFIYTFALNFVWGVFPLFDISQIFHPLTSYKNISYYQINPLLELIINLDIYTPNVCIKN